MVSPTLPLLLALVFYLSPSQATRDVQVRAKDLTMITYSPPGAQSWADSTTNVCGSEFLFSRSDYATLTVNFTGIAFSINLIRWVNGARALIEVDGKVETTVDTYAATMDCFTPVFTKTGLSDSPHLLKISDATHNATGKWLRFNGITYTEYTPEDRAQTRSASYTAAVPSISVASVSSVSVASVAAASSSARAQASNKSEDRKEIGIIVGASVGGVLGLTLIGCGVWFFLRKRRNEQRKQSLAYPPSSQPAPTSDWKSVGSPPLSPTILPYQHSGATTAVGGHYVAPQQMPYYPQGAYPQSQYSQGERPLSQYSEQSAQGMANMVADMVASRMQQGQPGGPSPPIPEVMDVAGTSRRV